MDSEERELAVTCSHDSIQGICTFYNVWEKEVCKVKDPPSFGYNKAQLMMGHRRDHCGSLT